MEMQGTPAPKKSRKKLWIIIGLVVAIAIIAGAIAGSAGEKDEKAEEPETQEQASDTPAVSEPQEPEYSLTVDQLCGEYEANEIAADEKYEDKVIELTGVVDDVGTEIMGSGFIMLAGDGFGNQAQCVMVNKDEAASVTKGQTITLQGKIQGKMGWVILEECTLK